MLTSAQISSLRTELSTDPTGIYGTAWTVGDNDALVAAINAPRAGVSVGRGVVPTHVVFEAMDAGEWSTLSAIEKQRVETLLAMGTIDLSGARTRATLTGIFPSGSVSRAALVALTDRQGSRAEQLFGAGVVVTIGDVRRARNA